MVINSSELGQNMGKKQIIDIPSIHLEWSNWTHWDDMKSDASGGFEIPNKASGVYEVKRCKEQKRLTIGKASNLKRRVKRELVEGKGRHSAGKQIHANENTASLIIRWAITDRPSAVEEALHKKHIKRFGSLPKYVNHT